MIIKREKITDLFSLMPQLENEDKYLLLDRLVGLSEKIKKGGLRILILLIKSDGVTLDILIKPLAKSRHISYSKIIQEQVNNFFPDLNPDQVSFIILKP